MWAITCECGFQGSTDDFNMSLSDECFCPKCDACFIIEEWGDEDEEEEIAVQVTDDDGQVQ